MIPHTTAKTPLDTTNILNAIVIVIATVMAIIPITAILKKHEITRPHLQIPPSTYPSVSTSMASL